MEQNSLFQPNVRTEMVVLGIVAGLATTVEKNDDYIESNEQLDRCVKIGRA